MKSPPPGPAAAAAALTFGVPFEEVLASRRGKRAAARARQFAVYLQHVALSQSISACARAFGRDRATVRHACARIEDLRDDARFDDAVTRLEALLVTQHNRLRELLAGGAA